MRGSFLPFARNANGNYAIDPVSLERIPLRRAVRVGPHSFDSKVLREILKRNTRNPLTREPFPRHVIDRYGIGRPLNSMNWEPTGRVSRGTARGSVAGRNGAVPMDWEPTRTYTARKHSRPRAPKRLSGLLGMYRGGVSKSRR